MLLSFLAEEDLEERELDELEFPEADFAFLLFPQAMVFLLKMLIKLIVELIILRRVRTTSNQKIRCTDNRLKMLLHQFPVLHRHPNCLTI